MKIMIIKNIKAQELSSLFKEKKKVRKKFIRQKRKRHFSCLLAKSGLDPGPAALQFHKQVSLTLSVGDERDHILSTSTLML